VGVRLLVELIQDWKKMSNADKKIKE